MAPRSQTLYCYPNDLYDFLGEEGAQLRVDDHDLATGQTITVTTNAAALATSLSITALQFPLLNGTTLTFDGGGDVEVTTVVLSATALVGATSLQVYPLANAINQYAAATDSGLNIVTAGRLILACNRGTDRVNRYCLGRYNATDLATTWAANEWAVTLGSYWLARRFCRTAPQGIDKMAEEAIKELRYVQMGQMQVPGIGTRSACWPWIDNISLSVGNTNHKLRLQTTISDPTPTQYGAFVDWSDALNLEM